MTVDKCDISQVVSNNYFTWFFRVELFLQTINNNKIAVNFIITLYQYIEKKKILIQIYFKIHSLLIYSSSDFSTFSKIDNIMSRFYSALKFLNTIPSWIFRLIIVIINNKKNRLTSRK